MTHHPITSHALVAALLLAQVLSGAAFVPRGPALRRPPSRHLAQRRGGGDPDAAAAPPAPGLRLNKVFKATHSRREADKLIAAGRVRVNGAALTRGVRVVPFRDAVTLDGRLVRGWEAMNAVDAGDDDGRGDDAGTGDGPAADDDDLRTSAFEYVKYYKPLGVTCTTDPRVAGNVVEALRRDGYRPRHRVYPVGRLDKATSGLIVLTSDGRLVNAALRGERKQPKVYKVLVNGRLEEGHLQRLREGIVISTVAQRKGRSEEENTLVARTKECHVERLGPSGCRMTLVEGRNRQIRKMMEALGLRVVRLHREEFLGIRLLTPGAVAEPGDWARLDAGEMRRVEAALRAGPRDGAR